MVDSPWQIGLQQGWIPMNRLRRGLRHNVKIRLAALYNSKFPEQMPGFCLIHPNLSHEFLDDSASATDATYSKGKLEPPLAHFDTFDFNYIR